MQFTSFWSFQQSSDFYLSASGTSDFGLMPIRFPNVTFCEFLNTNYRKYFMKGSNTPDSNFPYSTNPDDDLCDFMRSKEPVNCDKLFWGSVDFLRRICCCRSISMWTTLSSIQPYCLRTHHRVWPKWFRASKKMDKLLADCCFMLASTIPFELDWLKWTEEIKWINCAFVFDCVFLRITCVVYYCQWHVTSAAVRWLCEWILHYAHTHTQTSSHEWIRRFEATVRCTQWPSRSRCTGCSDVITQRQSNGNPLNFHPQHATISIFTPATIGCCGAINQSISVESYTESTVDGCVYACRRRHRPLNGR